MRTGINFRASAERRVFKPIELTCLLENEYIVVCRLTTAYVSELGRREALRQFRRQLLRFCAVGVGTAEEYCKVV